MGEGKRLAETGNNHTNVSKGVAAILFPPHNSLHIMQVPNLFEITREYELYTYLKDGTELLRMIGLLVTGCVPDGIVYRSSNISILEEKNVSLFVNFAEKELRLESIFGAFGSNVFNSFANFYIALSGLACLSQKIQTKFKIPGFTSSGIKTDFPTFPFTNYAEYSSRAIQGYKGADENLFNKVVVLKDQKTMKGLDYAMKEIIEFNERFLKEVLEPLTLLDEANTNNLLERDFFPVLRLKQVVKLHEKLKHKFEKLPYAYDEIGNYFADTKDEFLVYAEISARLKVAMDFFADVMSEKYHVRHCLERKDREVEQSSEESTELKELQKSDELKGIEKLAERIEREMMQWLADFDTFKGIQELAQSIMHHAWKWPELLHKVQRRAGKEENKEVEQEARRAYNIVSDVMKHVDLVTSDFLTARVMNDLKEQIKNCPYEDLTLLGALKQELIGVDFAQGTTAGTNFRKVDLLIFEENVLVVEQKAKVYHKSVSQRRIAKAYQAGSFRRVREVELQEKERFFLKDYMVKEFASIIMSPPYEGDCVMWVKSGIEGNWSEEKSFALKLAKDLASQLEQDLRYYMNTGRDALKKGTKHECHECQEYQGKGTLEETAVRCGECNQMMQGLFFTGVDCKTCNEIYHKGCFSLKKDNTLVSEEEEAEIKDPENALFVKRNTLQLNDFYIEGVDENKAGELMRLRRPGVFLMTDGPNGKVLIIKENENANLKSFDIKSENIQGENLFYIGQGVSASSILGLVKKVRIKYRLHWPINEPENENEYKEQKKTDEESHNAYFWGDITAAEAVSLLKNQDPGTFLLRKNGEVFKMSWISFGNRNLHVRITHELGFYVLFNEKFPTLCELVSFCQRQPHTSKIALGSPMINPGCDHSRTGSTPKVEEGLDQEEEKRLQQRKQLDELKEEDERGNNNNDFTIKINY